MRFWFSVTPEQNEQQVQNLQCRGEYNMIHELTFLSQANMTYLFQNLHIIMHILMHIIMLNISSC